MSKAYRVFKVVYYILGVLAFLILLSGNLIYMYASAEESSRITANCFDYGICKAGAERQDCAPDGSYCIITAETCKANGIWRNNTCYLSSYGYREDTIPHKP
ncbi:MAG: hypothetical protein IKD08_02950 [Alphaproteobacteria bacterium]|nr:hypothetical protein [Alphaproteobacteria bacterium]